MRSFRKKDEERDFDILVWKPHWSQLSKQEKTKSTKAGAPEKYNFAAQMLDYPNK